MQASPLEVQVDGQTPESWGQITQQFADASIYQTWAYGSVCWGSNSLSHIVIHRHGKPLAAAQLRIAQLPLVSAGLAYVRWPMCEAQGLPLDEKAVYELLFFLQQEYVERRGLTLQIIPRVFREDKNVSNSISAFSKFGMREEPSLGGYQTVVIDLSPAADVLRKQLNSKWRNQLNRAEKNNLLLEVSDTDDAYREFLPLYGEMWTRKNFSSTVDVEEFRRIQQILTGRDRMQTFLARSDGKIVAAIVCSLLGDKAIYILGATNEQARALKAAYVLQWRAMLWLKEHGAKEYDLGGIDSTSNPGGYHFKAGFGGQVANQLTAYEQKGNFLSSGIAAFVNWRRRARATAATKSMAAPVEA